MRGGSDKETNLLSLCHKCHGYIHNNKFSTSKLVREGLKKRRDKGLLNGKPPFGYDIIDGKMKRNKGEQLAIRFMKRAYDETGNCSEVARRLQAKGFKTKFGKRVWERRTVGSVLKREYPQ